MTTADRTLTTGEAAFILGIAAATIRDWRRRGLITPAGGTERRPLWSVADLIAARDAPKNRRS
jgi:DNA-binding transcriptional MerR regulator